MSGAWEVSTTARIEPGSTALESSAMTTLPPWLHDTYSSSSFHVYIPSLQPHGQHKFNFQLYCTWPRAAAHANTRISSKCVSTYSSYCVTQKKVFLFNWITLQILQKITSHIHYKVGKIHYIRFWYILKLLRHK